MTPAELTAKGYRRTSRKYGMVSRIDRPDWIEVLSNHMMMKLPDMEKRIRGQPGSMEDFYRRVLSKDKLTLGYNEGLKIPCSDHDSTGYIP